MKKITTNNNIKRIVLGCWQFAGGHGEISQQQALKTIDTYYKLGFDTFDCADIYTGVEEILGIYNKKLRLEGFGSLKIHTKFVPDRDRLGDITQEYVEEIIDRSLDRLQVDCIELVQYHWWDYSVKNYIKTINILQSLQAKGKIKHIGLTNFDLKHTSEIINTGVSIASNQVQISPLDMRACQANFDGDIHLYAYGVLAGGFMAKKWLNTVEPSMESLGNRSLVKYKLVIDDGFGWEKFQILLNQINEVALQCDISIAETVIRYTLSKIGNRGSVIIGIRNAKHRESLVRILNDVDNQKILLDQQYVDLIDALVNEHALTGDVYGLERRKDGKHASIMKYNLNKD